MEVQQKFLTIDQARAISGYSKTTLRLMFDRGDIQGIRLPTGERLPFASETAKLLALGQKRRA